MYAQIVVKVGHLRPAVMAMVLSGLRAPKWTCGIIPPMSAVEGRTDMLFKVAAQKVKLVVGGPAFGSRASSSLRRL